jgi:hypothetical protein
MIDCRRNCSVLVVAWAGVLVNEMAKTTVVG